MKTFIAFLLTIPQTLAAGLVFSYAWNWFIVRKFPSTPTLTMLDAVGLLMVAGFPLLGLFVMHAKSELRKDKPDLDSDTASIILSLVMTFITYPVLLGVAWIWHQIIGN